MRRAEEQKGVAHGEGKGVEEGEGCDDDAQAEEMLLQGNYVLQVHQFTEIARFLVAQQVSIPTELMQMIRACVRLRNRCLTPFLSQPDESTYSHAHFIEVLCDVYWTFEEHRQSQATEAAAAKGQPAPAPAPSPTNRFALLEDLGSAAEDEEEMPDIQLPEAAHPSKSGISARQVRGDLEDTRESMLQMLQLFFADMHSVRAYIRALWTDYRDSKIDLLTASVTTNTALELLRRPHDELMERALPFFQNDVSCAVLFLLNHRQEQEEGPLGHHELRHQLADFSKLTEESEEFLRINDYYFMPNLQVLIYIIKNVPRDGFPLAERGFFGRYDHDLDFDHLDFQTRWTQGNVLLMESYLDYFLLMQAPKELIQASQRASFNALQERLKTHKPLKFAAQELNPFRMDECAIEMEAFTKSRKPTLLAMLHMEVFKDMNFVLGRAAGRGLAELRIRALTMLHSLDQRDQSDHAREGSPYWSSEDEQLVDSLKVDLGYWSHGETPVTHIRRCYMAGGAHRLQGLQVEEESTLMDRSPLISGLLLFKLQLRMQQIGLKMANASRQIMACAHLLVACRHSGNLPGKSGPEWADMDVILEMHSADIFGSKVPEDVKESLNALLRVTNAPAKVMLSIKHIGTESEQPPSDRLRQRPPPGTSFRQLQDHSPMLLIFQRRFIGDASGTRIDSSVVETLLNDMYARAEREWQKLQLKEAAGAAGSKQVRRKLLRKERSHRSAKFSIPQLLAVLEMGLRLETESIRFDYVSMSTGCLEVLKATLRAAPDPCPSGSKKGIDATLVPGYILIDAITDKRRAELHKLTRDGDKVYGKLLVRATEGIRAHFAKYPTQAGLELNKLRGDRTREWDEMLVKVGIPEPLALR